MARKQRLCTLRPVKLGIAMFPTDYAVRPDELAALVEERGFESLWFPEHTHIPVSRETPYPGGGELPEMYSHTYDPFVALTAAAGATSTLLIATGICLVIQRDPIVTAKEVASIDRLSDGRFLFGIGGGWNREEMADHGTDPDHRFRLMRERVEAMKAIWTEDEAEYHGRYVNFDSIWSWPKPTQKPHPPIVVGGNGDNVLKRVVSYGDEWLPNRLLDEPERLGERIVDLQRMAEDAGRGEIPVTISGARSDPELLKRHEAIGVSRATFYIPSVERDEAESRLDHLAEKLAPVRG
jgi:probable F420-dependent oxidoreductase